MSCTIYPTVVPDQAVERILTFSATIKSATWGTSVQDWTKWNCGRQPLKNLKWYAMLKQTITLKFFKDVFHKFHVPYSSAICPMWSAGDNLMWVIWISCLLKFLQGIREIIKFRTILTKSARSRHITFTILCWNFTEITFL